MIARVSQISIRMLHQVNKLQFEARCGSEAQAFDVRHRFSRTLQTGIAEVIDRVCTKYVTDEEWIRIDRIEVDLGDFDIHQFEEHFTRNFLSQFDKEVSQRVGAITASEKALSREASYPELLLFFLQTGTVPWWVDQDEIDMDSIFMNVAATHATVLRTFLYQHQFSPDIWRRIAFQFHEDVHNFIISIISLLHEMKARVDRWYEIVSANMEAHGNEIIFHHFTEKSRNIFILENASHFFRLPASPATLEALILEFTSSFKLPSGQESKPSYSAEAIMAYEKSGQVDKQLETDVMEKLPDDLMEPLLTNDAPVSEKYIVHTAGLVLLAPFFRQFFTHLHLLDGKEWKDAESQYKAIHLARFLSTGEDQSPEYTLVFEKLLCGMNIAAPIPLEVEIREDEKNEAIELLRSVISSWTKLKNTSIGGLRETFLKRDGLLTRKENGWLLQVEQKTPDVLLESIPWSFHSLALSWNPYIIFTEW